MSVRGRTGRRSTGFLTLALLACGGPPDPGVDDDAPANQELTQAVEALEQRVRATIVGLQEQVADVDDRYAGAGREAASGWDQSKVEVRRFAYEVESQLERLRRAEAEEARVLMDDVARSIEAMAMRIERARLESAPDPGAFLVLARARLMELEQDVEALGREVQEASDAEPNATAVELERIRGRTLLLETRIETLADADAERVQEDRSEITRTLAELSARVRRRLIELQHALTDL